MSAPALFQPAGGLDSEHDGAVSRVTDRQLLAVEDRDASVRVVSVEEGYKLWAATYDDQPNPLLALEERVLAPLLPDVRRKNVLDAGCGTGRWLRRLVSRGARTAAGVDSSAAMLERAVVCPELVHRLIRADCLALPVRPRTVDLIVCSFTIGHIGPLDVLAREFSRVARPDADVFLTDLHPQAQAEGWRVGFRCRGASIEVEACLHTKPEIRQSFESGGFSLIGMRDLNIGEPERPIFSQAGKESMFEMARAFPAVMLCHFRLT